MLNRHTTKQGTQTSQGFIPHLERYGIWLPVKVTVTQCPVQVHPVTQNGKYVYALPGGGEYVHNEGV
jgi:hypothetical protein